MEIKKQGRKKVRIVINNQNQEARIKIESQK